MENSCLSEHLMHHSLSLINIFLTIYTEISDTGPPKNQYQKTREDSSSHDDPHSLKAKMLEAAVTAFASIIVLGTGFGLGGYLYHRFYKWMVLHKMEIAFKPGDPVLDLAATTKQMPKKYAADDDEHWIHRAEQEKIDKIVNGEDRGHYHLLIGEKGVGKSSMLLEAMQKIDGEGCSMFEAHADPEIFRVRLGKALNFEFSEDYIGSYFSERGPRDSTALLDIERAMNKLEKVALKRRNSGRGPLVSDIFLNFKSINSTSTLQHLLILILSDCDYQCDTSFTR